MGILVVETYVVRADRQMDFASFWKKFLAIKKKNADTFREVKSFKAFTQVFGGISGAHIDVWEYESLADLAGAYSRMSKDKEFMKLQEEFTLLIETHTYSTNVWNSVT